MTELDLFSLARNGDIDARNELVSIHAGIVHFVARRLMNTLSTRADLDELMSAGNIGLMQAVEGFDPELGHTFSTYATLRIRGAMLDELRRSDAVSRTTRARTREIGRVRRTLNNRFGRRATAKEVATEAGVDLRTLWNLEHESARGIELSLDAPFGGDDDEARPFGDSLSSDFPDVEIEFDREREREFVREALEELEGAERDVLAMYFFEELTLAEIAPRMGVTESGVSRIRTRALRKLRVRLERRGYQTAFAA